MKVLLFLIVSLVSVSAFSLQYDESVPDHLKAIVNTDLEFASSLKFEKQTPLFKNIFFEKENAIIQFFKSRILSVHFTSATLSIYAFVNTGTPHKVTLTGLFLSGTTQMSRTLIMYHEARHSETIGAHWLHAICPKSFTDGAGKTITFDASLAGQPSCDTTEVGGYGVAAILGRNISKYCTNCNEKTKMDAEIYAKESEDRIIDIEAKKRLVADSTR